jgi:sodium transport system permease protein
MFRLSVILSVLSKEVRELLRDRRSLLVMFGVPLVVYPLLFAGVGALARGKAEAQRLRPARIYVTGGENAPELMRRLTDPEARFELLPGPLDQRALQTGKADAFLDIPPDAERKLLSDHASTRPADDAFRIKLDRSRADSDTADARLRNVFEDYEKWLVEQRLRSRDIPPDLLIGPKRVTIDIATQDQRLGRFLAQLLPVLLLVTGMLGAFFPALNATTTEREMGTLETLLVSPARRMELLLAKGSLVLMCSILTAGINLVSMSAVFANIAAQSKEALGSVAVNPGALALAFLSVIPSLVLFSAVVMCVGMIARTYREANSFAAPVMMLPMGAMAIGMADPETSRALLATPVANTTILIRDILTARFEWGNFLLAGSVNIAFAFVVLSVAARLFSNEQLVNPGWEPVSLRGFKAAASGKRPRRLPTVDEAIILMALTLIIQFYFGPWLGKWFTSGHLNALQLVTLLLATSFLAPSFLLAFLGRYRVPEVFSVRPPPAISLLAGALLGVGLVPVAMSYGQVQSWLLPAGPSDAAQSVARLIDASFNISPLLAAVIFGVVPGICEEIVFRGVVLSALRKRLPVHAAVWITGLAFAALHLDFGGLIPRTVLGAALGYITVYSGSIFPAMLLHAAFNGSQVGLIAWYEPSLLGTTQPTDATIPDGLRATSWQSLARLAGGALATVVAILILKHLSRTLAEERPASL